MATLSPHPKDLFQLWHEYEFGIGGRKPAKQFTVSERARVKFKYCRQKIVWDVIDRLVRSGYTSHVAIDDIYALYGHLTVSAITVKLRDDNKNGGHPQLFGVNAQRRQQQPQRGRPQGTQHQEVPLSQARRIAADGLALYPMPRLPNAPLENAVDGGMYDPGFRNALANTLDSQQQEGVAPRRGHCGISGCQHPTLELRDAHKCKRFAVCRNHVHPICAFGHVPPLCDPDDDDNLYCSTDCKEQFVNV